MRPTRDIGPRSILSHGLGTTYTGQVDSLSWKDAVRVATASNVAIPAGLTVGNAIDDITLVEGDRVLVKDQTAASSNGIWVAGASPERGSDMNESNEILGAIVTVISGTANEGTTWRVTNDADTTIDVDDINWDTFGGGGSITVSETDGSPSVDPTTEIQFPPDTVTDLGGGVVSIRDVPKAFIGAKVYNSTTQTMNGSGTNSGNTTLTFDSEEYDTDGFHSTSSNTGRMTIPAGMGGKYLVGYTAWATTGPSTGGTIIDIWINGGGGTAGHHGVRSTNEMPVPSGGTVWEGTTILTLAASEYLELTMNNPNAGTFTVGHASAPQVQTALWLYKLDSGTVGQGIGALVYHNTTQTVNNTVVPFNSEVFDTDGFHSTSSNTSRLTIPAGLGGLYLLEYGSNVGSLAAGEFFRIRRTPTGGGATSLISLNEGGTSGDELGYLSGQAIYRLDAGDYVELYFTGNRTLGHASAYEAQSHFGIARLDSGSMTWPALPTVLAAGTSATGTGDVTPTLPTGHTAGDILLLFVQSGNQSVTAPAGYSKLGPFAGFGTAAAAGATRLTVFWKRDGGSESNPTVTDTGDHTLAQMIAVRGCPSTGDPFLCVGANRKPTASTTGTASAGATPVDNCLVINAFTHALDSASAVFSAWTNADLTNVTEVIDVATADGNGGGIGVAYGQKVQAGNFAATTVTETSTADVSLTFIMLPGQIYSRAGFIDRQVFLTAGVDDTWTRPTGGKRLLVNAIGGGASGSAGRNAATAAGGGGGGGGMGISTTLEAFAFSTATVVVGAGGAATANTDSAASNVGNFSRVTSGSYAIGQGAGGGNAGNSGSGSGGLGGQGGTIATGITTAGADGYGSAGGAGGTGGTTAMAGGRGADFGGGGGAGGGTTQAASAGGYSIRGGGGGGGGRSNTNVGTGGTGGNSFTGGATAGASGTDSTSAELGGGGGAGGTSAAGPGGTGGWPGGGGGGGGSQSGAQRGGAGGDGVVVIVTYC